MGMYNVCVCLLVSEYLGMYNECVSACVRVSGYV